VPPKPHFTKQQITDAAFEIARTAGLQGLSARELAARLGCSTSPIYTYFKNMRELEDIVCELSTKLMLDYQTQKRTDSPLLDMCVGYVVFAKQEDRVFRDMFMEKESLSPHSQEMKTFAYTQLMEKVLSREPLLAGIDSRKKRKLLEILWTYTHGLATQINIGALDLPNERAMITHLKQVLPPIVASFKS
jgi:AcrR family transcriptional regulator